MGRGGRGRQFFGWETDGTVGFGGRVEIEGEGWIWKCYFLGFWFDGSEGRIRLTLIFVRVWIVVVLGWISSSLLNALVRLVRFWAAGRLKINE